MPEGVLRRLTGALHSADHAVGRLNRTRRVLVEMRTPVYHAVLGPVIEAIQGLSGVEVWFTSEYPDRIRPLVGTERFLTREQSRWRRYDVYLNADPWAAMRLRRSARRINFFHGVAGKYDLDRPAGLPMGFEYYDRVAFINSDRMQRYLDAGVVADEQARLIGYPKLDRLATGGIDGAKVRSSLGLDPHRRTALYAPTYSRASSLHVAGEGIIRSLAASGFNVIVKLHDRSLDTDPRYTEGIDWRDRIQRIEDPGRITLVEGADSSPYLAAADVMVTDHSSVGFEYLVTDRPLLIFDAPDLARAARINEDKIVLLRGAAVVVNTPEGLARAAHDELSDPGRLSDARRRVVQEMFHEPGTATDRAVSLVQEMLASRVGATQSLPDPAGFQRVSGGIL